MYCYVLFITNIINIIIDYLCRSPGLLLQGVTLSGLEEVLLLVRLTCCQVASLDSICSKLMGCDLSMAIMLQLAIFLYDTIKNKRQ
jgi:hypothetical protein